MRIAYICADPGVPVFGSKGCSIHVQEVVRAMCAMGHQVTLFATRFDGVVPDDLAGRINILALPPAPKGDLAEREQICLKNNAGLTEALSSAGPFDLMYERYSLWSDAGILWATGASVPSILEVNAPLLQEHAEQRGLVDVATATRIAHDVFASATAIVTVSNPLVQYVEQFEPASIGRVHAVPNGVNPDRFIAREARDASQPFTIGFVGSFKPWHGVEVLVEAFESIHDSRLLIIGDGPERNRIERLIASRGFEQRVELRGAVPHQDVPQLLSEMDVAVAPYLPRDNFYFSPIKVYEYMAAGIPVIASRTGQMIDAIRDGETGLLVTPGDSKELARAIGMLRSDPQLRRRLRRLAREEVVATRSWLRIVRQILALPPLAQLTTGAAT